VTHSWQELAAVFDAVAPLPPDERARFLDERCADDPELRREIESLLERDAQAASYLVPPTSNVAERLLGPLEGAVVGGFRLLRRIGAGGMGSVYEAQQTTPARRVALKFLPPLSAAPEARTRFAQEAELLARMNHPSIARVYTSGVDGETPYLAMELVEDALPITDYVHRKALTSRATIELFRTVCAAVAHGHARGVVHRDLKPTNVLVDTHGTPKVIDFGVARAIDATDKDGPRMTRTGALVGTLQYMSPEQAEGLSKDAQPQSDVHALGLVLYELLSGHPARSVDGKSMTQTLRCIAEETIPPVRRVRADLEPEIEWILDKALETDRARRYASVVELDLDLERYLAHEPVLAGPRSRAHEVRLWVRRHPTAAAVIAVFSISLVTVAALAVQNIARKRDVFRLADAERLRDLERRADELWPARSERSTAMRTWLDEARSLIANVEDHRATLAGLRARSQPRSREEELGEASVHPRAKELEDLQRSITAKRAVLARRCAIEPVDSIEPDVQAFDGIEDWLSLQKIAWEAVDPDLPDGSDPRVALALARRALEIEGCDRALVLDTIAWAHFALGDDEGANDAGRRALEQGEAAEALYISQERLHIEIDRVNSPEAIAQSERELADLERRAGELHAEVREQRRWTFADPSEAWWQERLTELVASLEVLADPAHGLLRGVSRKHGIGIEQRLELIELQTRSLTENAASWEATIHAVAMEPRFRGLALQPQIGLVPLGADPLSGLQEFADLSSGLTPVRNALGRLVINPDSAVVFVLIPPGRFLLGAQADDPSAPQFDPRTTANETPLRRLELDAFFISKYELTQEQWVQATGWNPSLYSELSMVAGGEIVGKMHPVEGVSWRMAKQVLERYGWLLPTEAQWEYAARAGTTTPWWTGTEAASLDGAANITDRHCKKFGPTYWSYEESVDDGYVVHAPIGRYRANAFGLHDVCGNVFEWCADVYAPHSSPRRKGDGLVLSGGEDRRVLRGGSFENNTAFYVRSAYRNAEPIDQGSGNSGVRPARPLTN